MIEHPSLRIRLFRLLSAILLLLLVAAPSQAMGDTGDLTGLWKAKKRFGPDARGTLVIRRSGAEYTADMVGRVMPIKTANGELDLIVATFAGSYSSRKGMFGASTDSIPRTILPAVREAGDDRKAPVVEREYVNPYGPSTDGSAVRPDGH